MKIVEGFDAASRALSRLGKGQGIEADEREAAVRSIIEYVRKNGDKALLEYTEKYDHAKLTELEVDNERISRACCEVEAGLLDSLKTAANRIAAFHQAQAESRPD